MAEPVMPFGKYRGKALSECPVRYLDWVLGLDNLDPKLKKDILDYLQGCAEWQQMKDEV
jgi:uncharacterized protein (DUF3820 family)